MQHLERSVWVFSRGRTSGVFSSFRKAEAWVEQHQRSGLLTASPLDEGVYDWAIRNHRFRPSKPHHGSPDQVASFDSASLAHGHDENGQAQAGREDALAFSQRLGEP